MNSLRYLYKGSTPLSQLVQRAAVKINDPLVIDDILKTRQLTRWKYDPETDSVAANLEFKDFQAAICFMNNTALLADQMEHHPEWFNVYNRLNVNLRTHDCAGVSERDIYMAQAMDRIFHIVGSQESVQYTDILVADFEKLME